MIRILFFLALFSCLTAFAKSNFCNSIFQGLYGISAGSIAESGTYVGQRKDIASADFASGIDYIRIGTKRTSPYVDKLYLKVANGKCFPEKLQRTYIEDIPDNNSEGSVSNTSETQWDIPLCQRLNSEFGLKQIQTCEDLDFRLTKIFASHKITLAKEYGIDLKPYQDHSTTLAGIILGRCLEHPSVRKLLNNNEVVEFFSKTSPPKRTSLESKKTAK